MVGSKHWGPSLQHISFLGETSYPNHNHVTLCIPEGQSYPGKWKLALWGGCFLFPEDIWRRSQGRWGVLLPGLCRVRNYGWPQAPATMSWTPLLCLITPWWTESESVPLITPSFPQIASVGYFGFSNRKAMNGGVGVGRGKRLQLDICAVVLFSAVSCPSIGNFPSL